MYIIVKLLNRNLKNLTYKLPQDFNSNNLIGSLVKVPLKNKIELAYVENIILNKDYNFTVKEVLEKELIPEDRYYNNFIEYLSYYYAVDKRYFFKKIQNFLKEKELKENLITENLKDQNIILTKEQENIVKNIAPNIIKNIYSVNLIHGVTGSGKTEVYKKLIVTAILNNKSVLILLPEISLAIEFYNIFKKEINLENSNFSIYSFHSATKSKEKDSLWQELNNNKNLIIIGVQLPIFLPISNLGLIIIDEEHDINFQSKKHPRINSKEASLIRAKICNIPVILGSATPSVSSLYNAEKLNWPVFNLSKRFFGDFAKIKIVKLTENKNRKNFWITNQLEKEIKIRLEKKEQIIIFLNRRGYSFFIQCKECSEIPTCINCSVSLTLHNKLDKNKNRLNVLICHYCNYFIKEPENCLKCKSSFIKKGIGTQQVVNILSKIFKDAKIARADLDSTVNKKKWQEVIDKFNLNQIDILVGTQTITKGYNFKNVTLVGILWADVNLSVPFYNSAEIALQQLIQVSGRAGRRAKESLVVIQTMITHKIYDFINEVDYKDFYNYEIQNRILLNYPPYSRFAEIEIKHSNLEIINKEVDIIAKELNLYNIKNHLNVNILGPVSPLINLIKNINIYKIYLKSQNIHNLIKIFNSIDKYKYKSQIFFTPNPLN